MRRCPHCQSPDPDDARYCLHCGQALEPVPRRPWLSLDDLGSWVALRRCALGALPVLAFALSARDWLTGGAARVESRVLAYHLAHGALIALGLAWARRERRASVWVAWLMAGLLGGLFGESLDLWFSYRQIFSGAALWLWQRWGLAYRPTLVYEILQGLRLLGLFPPLGAVYLARERRPARWLQAPLWLGLGLALRTQVRGVWLVWGACFSLPGLAVAACFYASVLALCWGLGPRSGFPDGGA